MSTWTPPKDYQEIESQVEGIQVYAPVQQAPPATETTQAGFKCPQCGATTRYDIAAGGVACEYCGYIAPNQAEQVGRRAAENEFTLDTWQQATKGWGVERRELRCESCGASLTLQEGALSITCPFCASNKVSIRLAPGDMLRPRFLIPFKVQTKQTRKLARDWLGRGWFHPAELAKTAAVERFNGIYLPFWTFDAYITADWKAEVGYEHTERYYDHGSKSWRTRTVIQWRWENGRVNLNVDDLLMSGSSHISRRILERLYPFHLNDLVSYAPDFLAGWQAQAYDLTLPVVWEDAREVMRERAKDACYEDIPTSHVRNFSMIADFAEETWRYILLPVYVAAYHFRDKVYQVMVNGQTGAIAGQKPVAWWKIWLVIVLLLAPGLLAILASLPLLALGGAGMVVLMLGLILLIAGGAGSYSIYKKAVESEAD